MAPAATEPATEAAASGNTEAAEDGILPEDRPDGDEADELMVSFARNRAEQRRTKAALADLTKHLGIYTEGPLQFIRKMAGLLARVPTADQGKVADLLKQIVGREETPATASA